MNIFAPKRTGLIGDIYDERDYIGTGDDVPLGGFKTDEVSPLVNIELGGKYVNLFNTYALKQGARDVYCTMYSGVHVRVIMQNLLNSKEGAPIGFYLSPTEQVIKQKEYPGTFLEGVGDYLNAPGKSLLKQPLIGYDMVSKQKKEFGIFAYKVADVSTWKTYLQKGYPILTGMYVGSKFLDKNYYWIPGGNKYGHCITIVGYDDTKRHFIALDVYGDTHFNNLGIFFINYDDATEMFRGRVFIL